MGTLLAIIFLSATLPAWFSWWARCRYAYISIVVLLNRFKLRRIPSWGSGCFSSFTSSTFLLGRARDENSLGNGVSKLAQGELPVVNVVFKSFLIYKEFPFCGDGDYSILFVVYFSSDIDFDEEFISLFELPPFLLLIPGLNFPSPIWRLIDSFSLSCYSLFLLIF